MYNDVWLIISWRPVKYKNKTLSRFLVGIKVTKLGQMNLNLNDLSLTLLPHLALLKKSDRCLKTPPSSSMMPEGLAILSVELRD